MNNAVINELCIQLQSLSDYAASQQPIPFNAVFAVRERIVNVAQQISSINAPISNHLIDLKNNLFIEIPYQCFCINQIAYGQTIECLESCKQKSSPKIEKI